MTNRNPLRALGIVGEMRNRACGWIAFSCPVSALIRQLGRWLQISRIRILSFPTWVSALEGRLPALTEAACARHATKCDKS